MPAAGIRFHPAATAARGFREELRHAIEAVAQNPETWPHCGRGARRYLFQRFPFSLVYVLRGGEVQILAVAHGRRRPGYWRSRL